MESAAPTFHLIPNSHLDPVWLWDWREGLNEGITTVRTILDLMHEHPGLTYIRGETCIYEEIRRHDPASFAEIKELIAQGRWDPVGGSYLQPDMNLPATESLLRQFEVGQRFYREHFGRTATVGWAADCFGHSAGLPDILHAAGLDSYIFGRPTDPVREKLFWWEGASGVKILASTYLDAWYGCERDEMPRRLDAYLAAVPSQRVRNIFIPFGLGNHGGGPTRRQIADVAAWAAQHPEVEVRYSGFHTYISAVREEIARQNIELPVVRGELNYCLRGVYSSAARIKKLYRASEVLAHRAETLTTAVALFHEPHRPSADADALWRDVMFNAFHDILPGSSIERAIEDQIEWMGGTLHCSRKVERDALLALASVVDTRVPAPAPDFPSAVSLMVWNPLPQMRSGVIEFEAALDYRLLFDYRDRCADVPLEVRGPDSQLVPFQIVSPEHLFMRNIPWRARVVVDAELPPLGWSVFTIGWVEGALPLAAPASPADAPTEESIRSACFEIQARAGDRGIRVLRDGQPFLSGDGLTLITVSDPFGPWGGHYEEPESHHLTEVRREWRVVCSALLERGPLRAALWVRLSDGQSRCDLTLRLTHNQDLIDVQARVFLNEERVRLKVVVPSGTDAADYAVPGGVCRRGSSGEVPGGTWVRLLDAEGQAIGGFASDAIMNFDQSPGVLCATLVRASRHTLDTKDVPDTTPIEAPAIDSGEFLLNFRLSGRDLPAEELAAAFEHPVLAMPVTPTPGPLPRRGSTCHLEPASIRLLAMKPAHNGLGVIVRLQSPEVAVAHARLHWLGQEIPLGPLSRAEIRTVRLIHSVGTWSAESASLLD